MALIDVERHELRQQMMDDLQRALKKPMEDRHWAMVIDQAKCVGCTACTTACVSENHLPPGVVYRPVVETEVGTFPNVRKTFLPRPCMQCEDPPCVKVCPANATWKRADGIVAIDYNRGIGCRYCISACPYAARTFDLGFFYTDGTPQIMQYEKESNFEYGKAWPRNDRESSPVGNARKCTYCIHRLEKGMLPACVTTCIGDATYFGDANDPQSLIAELLGSPRARKLREEEGTKPTTTYLV